MDEWVAGDHISLHANPLYFRASEGLPYFDNLVYRFVADSSEAQSAVLAGECDLVDQTAGLESQTADLLKLQDEGRLSLVFQTAFAWDVLEFDLSPLACRPPGILCLTRSAPGGGNVHRPAGIGGPAFRRPDAGG